MSEKRTLLSRGEPRGKLAQSTAGQRLYSVKPCRQSVRDFRGVGNEFRWGKGEEKGGTREPDAGPPHTPCSDHLLRAGHSLRHWKCKAGRFTVPSSRPARATGGKKANEPRSARCRDGYACYDAAAGGWPVLRSGSTRGETGRNSRRRRRVSKDAKRL